METQSSAIGERGQPHSGEQYHSESNVFSSEMLKLFLLDAWLCVSKYAALSKRRRKKWWTREYGQKRSYWKNTLHFIFSWLSVNESSSKSIVPSNEGSYFLFVLFVCSHGREIHSSPVLSKFDEYINEIVVFCDWTNIQERFRNYLEIHWSMNHFRLIGFEFPTTTEMILSLERELRFYHDFHAIVASQPK